MEHFKPENDKRGTSNGYKYVEMQHNGYLYAKLVGKYLYKKVVTVSGEILKYKPYVANKYERRAYN